MSGYASDPDHPDFHAVEQRLLNEHWEAHAERDRLVQLQKEGWRTGCRDDPDDPDWLEWILYPPSLHDGRGSPASWMPACSSLGWSLSPKARNFSADSQTSLTWTRPFR